MSPAILALRRANPHLAKHGDSTKDCSMRMSLITIAVKQLCYSTRFGVRL